MVGLNIYKPEARKEIAMVYHLPLTVCVCAPPKPISYTHTKRGWGAG